MQLVKRAKRHIAAAASKRLWTHYMVLAPYLGLRAAASTFTGRTTSGTIHAQNPTRAVEYISHVFHGYYKHLTGVARFSGKIAEIGPGESCGVGLLFLADGCEQVDLLDRFYTPRDESFQREINRSIVSAHPQLTQRLLDTHYSERSFAGLTRHYGEKAAAEAFFNSHRDYSAIVSCAVVEHLYDPISALSSAFGALNPGGMMVHGVDCRDHLMFSEHFHELTFLELPAALYAPFRWNGGPNRVRLSAYTNLMNQRGLAYSLHVTRLAGIEPDLPLIPLSELDPKLLAQSQDFVSSVRNRLARPFRDMDELDLMVQGFFITARKP